MDDSPVRSAAVLYERSAKMLNQVRPFCLLLLRLYIGYQSAKAGYNHFRYFDKTAGFFASLHIPMPRVNVVIAAGTELVGGILIAIGFLTRLVAIPFSFNFVVAIVSVALSDPDSRDKLFHLWNDQDVILKDTAFPFLFVGLLMLFFGPGCFSIDGLIKCKLLKRSEQPA